MLELLFCFGDGLLCLFESVFGCTYVCLVVCLGAYLFGGSC